MEKILLVAGCATLILTFLAIHQLRQDTAQEENTVDYVHDLDINRFMGQWYVIASLPNMIESNCKCSRTVDTRKDEKTITLEETCMMFGNWITSNSKAVISEPNTGKWVNWNYFLKADYWVLDVDRENYSWNVIGQPNFSGYWIMARTKTLDQSIVDGLIADAVSKGFNLKKLEYADQSCEE